MHGSECQRQPVTDTCMVYTMHGRMSFLSEEVLKLLNSNGSLQQKKLFPVKLIFWPSFSEFRNQFNYKDGFGTDSHSTI